MNTEHLYIAPDKVARFLALVAGCLVLANTGGLVSKYYFGHGYLFGLVPLFDVDMEASVPNLFTTSLMLLCSTLLIIISIMEKRLGNRSLLWLILALIFLFLAVDEYSSLHERIEIPLRKAWNTSGLLYFAWVIPYGGFLVLLTLIYGRFILRMPGRCRRLMIVSAVVYVTGAVGFECVGGWYMSTHDDLVDLPYGFLVTCEEALEMGGLVTFIYALLVYISEVQNGVTIHLGSIPSDGAVIPLTCEQAANIPKNSG